MLLDSISFDHLLRLDALICEFFMFLLLTFSESLIVLLFIEPCALREACFIRILFDIFLNNVYIIFVYLLICYLLKATPIGQCFIHICTKPVCINWCE